MATFICAITVAVVDDAVIVIIHKLSYNKINCYICIII